MALQAGAHSLLVYRPGGRTLTTGMWRTQAVSVGANQRIPGWTAVVPFWNADIAGVGFGKLPPICRCGREPVALCSGGKSLVVRLHYDIGLFHR